MEVVRLIVGHSDREIGEYKRLNGITPDDKKVFAMIGCQSLRGMRCGDKRINEVVLLPGYERLNWREKITTMENILQLNCPVYKLLEIF